jgi:hypothetical protein
MPNGTACILVSQNNFWKRGLFAAVEWTVFRAVMVPWCNNGMN